MLIGAISAHLGLSRRISNANHKDRTTQTQRADETEIGRQSLRGDSGSDTKKQKLRLVKHQQSPIEKGEWVGEKEEKGKRGRQQQWNQMKRW